MNRRNFVKAAGALSGFALTGMAHGQLFGTSQSEFVFYRNAQTPIIGTSSGAVFAFPGNALTASSFKLRANELGSANLLVARWVLVWTPDNPDPNSPTGVRLISADDGPSNIQQIARIDSPTGVSTFTPIVSAVNVTTALQNIISSLQGKNILQQTYGNGANGCKIYSSSIEMVWG